MVVHFLPVSIIFALLGLYAQNVVWTPPWPTTNVLNAFQFAAKVHESLMIASLVDILLHNTRYRLLSLADDASSGVPLGLVTSPFRLLDITYLWSWDFSTVCLHLNGRRRLLDATTIFTHIFLFVLAAILGPSSAVVMLPRLGQWELAHTVVDAPFFNTHLFHQVYIGAALTDVFPQRITRDFIPQSCDYSNLSLPQSNACPRLGLIDIVQGIHPPEYNEKLLSRRSYEWPDDEPDMYCPGYNITVQAKLQESLYTERIMLVTDSFWPLGARDTDSFQIGVDATTPTDVIADLIKLMLDDYMSYWTLMLPGVRYYIDFLSTGTWPVEFKAYASEPGSRDATTTWQQPYVSTTCSRKGRDTSVLGPVSFDFDQSDGLEQYTVSVDADYFSTQIKKTGMGFLDISNLSITPNFTPSASFAFVSQTYETLCLVKANWIDFDFVGPSDALSWTWQANSNIEPGHATSQNWFNITNGGGNIQLDMQWLDFLDHGTGKPLNSNDSFFEKVREICLGSSPMTINEPNEQGRNPDTLCMASGLALGITEGLSKTPWRFEVYALRSTEDTTHGDPASPMILSQLTSLQENGSEQPVMAIPGNWSISNSTPSQILSTSTRLDFVVDQRLYGYGFRGVTITLAFVVLFLYVATVLTHVLVLIIGPSWQSNAWNSLGELFILALRSPVPVAALENTGGGVTASTTWRLRASIRELHENRVGFVLESKGETAPEHGSKSHVRPDWKYS